MGKFDDLTSRRFGRLTAMRYERINGRSYWWCKCDCGKELPVYRQNLLKGATQSCGCINGDRLENLQGQRFGRLVATERLPEASRVNNCSIWRCVCDCGEIIDVAKGNLKNGSTQSCGCLHADISKEAAHDTFGHAFGTSISIIKSNKISKANTSGIKGVCWDKKREKWVAQIKFQGKSYFLGRYDDIRDAAKARATAKENLHNSFLEWYEENSKKL